MAEGLLPWIVLPALIALWAGMSWTVAKISGWRALYHVFGSPHWPVPKGKHLLSAKVGKVDYRCSIFVASDEAGLYLAVFPLFRIAHPTLFIPWKEFHKVRPSRHVLLDHVVATVGEPRITTLRIPRRSVRGTVMDPSVKYANKIKFGTRHGSPEMPR